PQPDTSSGNWPRLGCCDRAPTARISATCRFAEPIVSIILEKPVEMRGEQILSWFCSCRGDPRSEMSFQERNSIPLSRKGLPHESAKSPDHCDSLPDQPGGDFRTQPSHSSDRDRLRRHHQRSLYV